MTTELDVVERSLGTEAADAVSRLAADPRFAPREADLRQLGAALSLREEPGGWEKVDLFRAFPPSSTINVPTQSRADRVLAIVAAVSVFAPIAWTWYSLSRAAAAYRELLAAGGGDGASFLQLWVTGFDGRLEPYHQLIAVSLISVAMITVTVVLIGYSRWQSAHEVRAEEREFYAAEGELASALSLAQRALGQTLAADADSIERLVHRSISELALAHKRTSDAVGQLAQAASDTGEAVKPLLAQSASAIESAEKATRSSTEAASQLGTVLVQSEKQIARALDTLQDRVVDAATQYEAANVRALERSQGAVSDAANELVRSASDIAEVCKSISSATQQLGVTTSSMPKVLTDGVKRVLNDATTQIADSTSVLTQPVTSLQQSVDRIDEALALNQSATQSQTTELTQSRDALERIRGELEGLVVAISGKGVRP